MVKRPSQKPRWRRAMLVTLVVPPVVAIVIALVLSYQIYASNRTMDAWSQLPVDGAPRPPQSLLVFAPHCDDETLGAAGLMYQATHAGCDVHVVIISNGDGFRISASREFDKINVTSADFVKYGYLRQTEARTALKVVGVDASHVEFLGYPDRGLMPMWTTNWSRANPFRSYYTQVDHSPYSDSPTVNAPYCGEQLLADITSQMERDKPTDIYVTHPSDDHPDHAAASVFVRTALDRLRAKGVGWATHARLHYYLVHRGDWPVPQGLHEDYVLPPPAQMAKGETHWRALTLTPYQVKRKYAAIKRYHSQTEITGRFLFSFARRAELFGTVASGESVPLQHVSDGTLQISAGPAAWRGVNPVAIDAAGDSVGRAFQGSADITRIFMARDSSNLFVRLDMRNQLNKDVLYGVSLRPLCLASVQPPAIHLVVKAGQPGATGAVDGIDGAHFEWAGNSIVFQVPLLQLQLPSNDPEATVDVAAETKFAGMFVDRTGYHGVAVNPRTTASLVAKRPLLPISHS